MKQKLIFATLSLLLLTAFATSCSNGIRPPRNVKPIIVSMTVTAYCNCGKCCSWERSILRLGTPVYASGPNKGKRKNVGITANGTRAKHGTIAVDKTRFPFGTIFEVPGYGYGRAEDTGGKIKGNHIDLWFPTHSAAKKWGSKKLKVKIWKN